MPNHAQASRPVDIDAMICLTFATQHCTMQMLHNKEKHGIGDRETIHLCTGMDTTNTVKEERNAVSLRRTAEEGGGQERYGVALYRSRFQVGNHERARDTGETQQAIKKAGIEPAYDNPGSSRCDGLIDGP